MCVVILCRISARISDNVIIPGQTLVGRVCYALPIFCKTIYSTKCKDYRGNKMVTIIFDGRRNRPNFFLLKVLKVYNKTIRWAICN